MYGRLCQAVSKHVTLLLKNLSPTITHLDSIYSTSTCTCMFRPVIVVSMYSIIYLSKLSSFLHVVTIVAFTPTIRAK